MIIPIMCGFCGGPLVTERIKDAKWEKHGRVPREGRAVLVCKKCGQRSRRRGLSVAQAMATSQHVPVEEQDS